MKYPTPEQALRAERARIAAFLPAMSDEVSRLKAENARLRPACQEALSYLDEVGKSFLDAGMGDEDGPSGCDQVTAALRAALAAGEGEDNALR